MSTSVMRDKRMPQRPSQREQGFVQGVLLFALAVLVAIIAAFAFANNGNQSSSERENAKVTATVLMKQASDVQDAVSRYISDGQSLAYLCVTSGVSPTTSNPGIAGTGSCSSDILGTATDLWADEHGYITPPVAPQAAFRAGVTSGNRRWTYAEFSTAGRNLSSTVTDPGYYQFMELPDVDKKVCQAINRVLNISFPYTLDEDTKEMCYEKSTNTGIYVYRKAISTREPVGQ